MQGNKNPFKGRQFTAEITLWAVRWYLQFPISYRELECMFSDRGIQVDYTVSLIQANAPELEKRNRPYSSYDERLLAGRRNIYANEGEVGVPAPCC